MDRAGAAALGEPGDLDALLDRRAPPLPGIDGVVVVEAAELDDERHVLEAGSRADAFDHLAEEAIAVGQCAAIGVGAVVDRGAEELREEVPVAGMQLDAVELRRAHAMRGRDEARDHVPDLVDRHRAAAYALEIVAPVGRRLRRAVPVLDAGDVLLATRI